MSYRSASDRYGLTKLYPPIQFVDNGKTIVFESEHMISEGALYPAKPYHCFPICFIDSNDVIHLAWTRAEYHGGPGEPMYQRVSYNGSSWSIETPRVISTELASPGDTYPYGIRKIFETTDGAICLMVSQRHISDPTRRDMFGAKSFNGGDSFAPVDREDSLVTDYYWRVEGPVHAIKQNGYWIAPLFGTKDEGDSFRSGAAYISPETDGFHWTRLGIIGPEGTADYEENGVFQRPDKLVIGASRSDPFGRIDFNYSPNGGRKFSTPVTKSVPSTAKPEFVVTPSGTIFGYGRFNHIIEDENSWRVMRIISTDGAGSFSWDWIDDKAPTPSDANAQQYSCGVWHPTLQRIIMFYGLSHGTTGYNGDCDILMHVLREEDV